MSRMNENAFFDDMILFYLYKHGSISSLDTEDMFGGMFDVQNVNNVICNRGNSTSYIAQGYFKYDGEKQTLKITAKGKRFVESRYEGRRG